MEVFKSWTIPSTVTKSLEQGAVYRHPVKDNESGLDLSRVPTLEPSAAAAKILSPSFIYPVSLPLKQLENWELRERKSLGLSSQCDFLSSAFLKRLTGTDESISEDLRNLLLYLARSCQNLSSTSAINMCEMLRLRRDVALSRAQAGFLSDQAVDKLKATPLSAPTLFGNSVPEVLKADKEDRSYAMMIASTAAISRWLPRELLLKQARVLQPRSPCLLRPRTRPCPDTNHQTSD